MRLRSENKDRGAFDSMNQDLTETKSEKQNIFSDTGRKRAPVNALQQAPVTGTVNEMGDFQNSSDLNVDDSNLTEQSETQINHLHTNNYQRAREVLKPHSKYVIAGLQVTSVILILLYFVLPTTVRLFPCIISEIAFLHRVRWPPFVNLSEPLDVGLNYTRAFTLQTADDVKVGAWHTLPSSLEQSDLKDEDYVRSLGSGVPIMLYLHGNAGTRGGWHRVQLYKVLARAGFHVVSMDYRGFGDSSGSPTEDGVCDDGKAMYHWIKQHSGDSPLYIWGHSMGTGVATKITSQLCDEGFPLDGLFLEAPFNNIIEAATVHPFSQPFKFLPWFTWGFVEAMKYNKIFFSSDTSISRVTVPTLILHAKDDGIVPYSLGYKLYKTALTTKSQGGVQMITFDGDHGYGHKHIHKSPDLTDIIRKFILDITRN